MNETWKNKLKTSDIAALEAPLQELRKCDICPRNCGVDRLSGSTGYCNSDSSYFISSICVHHGEEPPISGPNGICNIFFGHCNLQCIYCQNHQISFNRNPHAAARLTLTEVLSQIIPCLESGCEAVGFVSPSHFIPQVKIIIRALHQLGFHPVTVFNTNAYDKPGTLRELEDLIDVYLPDFKYLDPGLAKRYSGAKDYPVVAKQAFREMYRQKGSTLITRKNGVAEQGILIRHLVLPGHVQNSIDVLRFIAEEVSTSVHISLMSQYHPVKFVANTPPLNRTLFEKEYRQVTDAFYRLGFRNGWIQDLDSNENYRPDFNREHPFEA